MAAKYTISLKKIIEVIGFDIEYTPVEPSEILVSSLEINRPGLMLSGFTKYFDPERIQIMGVSEIEYLNSFKPEDRYRKVKRLLSKKPVAIILTRGHSQTETGLISRTTSDGVMNRLPASTQARIMVRQNSKTPVASDWRSPSVS